jgi:hypothetical protein
VGLDEPEGVWREAADGQGVGDGLGQGLGPRGGEGGARRAVVEQGRGAQQGAGRAGAWVVASGQDEGHGGVCADDALRAGPRRGRSARRAT